LSYFFSYLSSEAWCLALWKPWAGQSSFRVANCRWAPTDQMIICIELNWIMLWRRRQFVRLSLLFKLSHQLLTIKTNQILIPVNRSSRHSHPFSYQKLCSSQNYYNYSIFPRTINNWNNLPASLVAAPSTEAFSMGLKVHAESSC